MNLGRQCPRIRELGSLYPSIGLRKALCDYYAAIIRLCKHITQSLRKPGKYTCYTCYISSYLPILLLLSPRIDIFLVYVQVSKALLLSFRAEFRSYEEEITRLSQDVRDEASLASKQAQKQENELQARERSDAKRLREIVSKFKNDYYKSNEEGKNWRLEINRRKLEKMRLKALDALSTYDFQKTYRQIRKECMPGTSAWVCKSPEFQAWMSGTSKTLCFTGRCKYILTPSALATLK